MTNLLPAKVKKSLVWEYWLRVVSVWFVVWGSAVLAAAVLFLPTYVLIGGQINQQNQSVDKAAESVKEYEQAALSIKEANKQAELAAETGKAARISVLIERIENLQGDKIRINSLNISRKEDNSFNRLTVAGTAEDRRSLASFRDRLLTEDWITAADLPISNLVQSSNINFSIPVEIKLDDNSTLWQK